MSQLTRRAFLKVAAAAGTSLATARLGIPSIARAQNQKMTILFHGGSPSGPYWDMRLGRYQSEHPNVELVLIGTDSDDDFVQKLSTMVAGGSPPDLVKLSGGRMLATAPTGVYEDLRPRIEASEFMSSIWEQMPDQGSELTYCGQQIAVPQDMSFRIWFYNKDIFDAAGVPYPTLDWTWEDIVTMGKAITNPDKNIWFMMPTIYSFQEGSEWFWQAGGRLFSNECMKVNLSEPENIAAMEFLVSLFKEHAIAPLPSLGLGDIGIGFDTGSVAMHAHATSTLAAQLGPNRTWEFNWGTVFAPTGPGGSEGYLKSDGWAIPKGASYADLAWNFIEWWHSDETATAFAESGELVPRADIRDTVSLAAIPEEHQATLKRASQFTRGLERCPGWNIAQRHWRQEMDTALSGNVPVAEALAIADAKAEAEMAELMAKACPA